MQLSHGSLEVRDVRDEHDCNDDDQQQQGDFDGFVHA
jgi:hypothetical protein